MRTRRSDVFVQLVYSISIIAVFVLLTLLSFFLLSPDFMIIQYSILLITIGIIIFFIGVLHIYLPEYYYWNECMEYRYGSKKSNFSFIRIFNKKRKNLGAKLKKWSFINRVVIIYENGVYGSYFFRHLRFRFVTEAKYWNEIETIFIITLNGYKHGLLIETYDLKLLAIMPIQSNDIDNFISMIEPYYNVTTIKSKEFDSSMMHSYIVGNK